MKKIALLILLLFITNLSFSQSIFGKWNSFDEETNKVESVIEVYQKDGKAFAKIKKINDQTRKDAKCIACNEQLDCLAKIFGHGSPIKESCDPSRV